MCHFYTTEACYTDTALTKEPHEQSLHMLFFTHQHYIMTLGLRVTSVLHGDSVFHNMFLAVCHSFLAGNTKALYCLLLL